MKGWGSAPQHTSIFSKLWSWNDDKDDYYDSYNVNDTVYDTRSL